MFLTAYVFSSLRLYKFKTEGQTIITVNRKQLKSYNLSETSLSSYNIEIKIPTNHR